MTGSEEGLQCHPGGDIVIRTDSKNQVLCKTRSCVAADKVFVCCAMQFLMFPLCRLNRNRGRKNLDYAGREIFIRGDSCCSSSSSETGLCLSEQEHGSCSWALVFI